MQADAAAVKEVLRQSARARRAALTLSMRDEASAKIAGHADLFAGFGPFSTVSGFIPLRGEIDPRPLMGRLADNGARIVLPRVTKQGLVFHLYCAGDELDAAPFGLSEPKASAPVADPDLLLVPLLAFDRRGNRLGYGKGYYDRTLARLPQAMTVGLAFAAQEVASVPVDPHDRPVDYMLTEQGLIDCRRQRGQ